MPSTSVHVRLDDPQCSAAPKPLPKLPPSWMDALVTAHVDTIITPVCRQMLRS